MQRSSVPSRRGPAGPVHGSPRLVAEALSAFLQKHGLVKGIEDHQVFLDWGEIVGASLAEHTRPVRIEGGTLWIDAVNASQANHLLYLRPWILRRIKERHPGASVSTIRVLHRPLGRWNR